MVIFILLSVVIVRHYCVTLTKQKTFLHDMIVYIYILIYTNHYYLPTYIEILFLTSNYQVNIKR